MNKNFEYDKEFAQRYEKLAQSLGMKESSVNVISNAEISWFGEGCECFHNAYVQNLLTLEEAIRFTNVIHKKELNSSVRKVLARSKGISGEERKTLQSEVDTLRAKQDTIAKECKYYLEEVRKRRATETFVSEGTFLFASQISTYAISIHQYSSDLVRVFINEHGLNPYLQ